ncbi:hypothetical protein [Streptomyces anandii]|uniref:hypothetical protein n=1 Tax=Streptomyces anandii TaxID=285454 RepID=UPI00369C0C80
MANLLVVATQHEASLRRALAEVVPVPQGKVDLADPHRAERNRGAPVLCTYRLLPPGDLALELDVTVEAGIAAGLATRTGSSVLHPAQIGMPSAYWVATVDGRSVRCRLEAVDRDEDTAYRVDAVEEPVADLPGANVEVLSEILDREHIETPVADAFLAGYPTGTTATVQGHVHYALRVWERLVRRMESDWSPSGRYRQDLFRRDLGARDDLASAAGRVGAPYAEGLRSSVAQLDAVYREYTDEDADCGRGGAAEGWWWRRCPRRVPW